MSIENKYKKAASILSSFQLSKFCKVLLTTAFIAGACVPMVGHAKEVTIVNKSGRTLYFYPPDRETVTLSTGDSTKYTITQAGSQRAYISTSNTSRVGGSYTFFEWSGNFINLTYVEGVSIPANLAEPDNPNIPEVGFCQYVVSDDSSNDSPSYQCASPNAPNAMPLTREMIWGELEERMDACGYTNYKLMDGDELIGIRSPDKTGDTTDSDWNQSIARSIKDADFEYKDFAVNYGWHYFDLEIKDDHSGSMVISAAVKEDSNSRYIIRGNIDDFNQVTLAGGSGLTEQRGDQDYDQLTDGQKGIADRFNALVTSAFTRGVFFPRGEKGVDSAGDWWSGATNGDKDDEHTGGYYFYQPITDDAQCSFDTYAQVLHQFAANNHIYAFPYDDIYGYDSSYGDGNAATITVLPFGDESVSN